MAFLISDIETIPRPTIDDIVEDAITKKVQSHIDLRIFSVTGIIIML